MWNVEALHVSVFKSRKSHLVYKANCLTWLSHMNFCYDLCKKWWGKISLQRIILALQQVIFFTRWCTSFNQNVYYISFKLRLQYQSFDDNGGNSFIIQMCMLRRGSKLLSKTKVSKLIFGIFCTFYGNLPKNKNYISRILGRMEIDFNFNSSPWHQAL